MPRPTTEGGVWGSYVAYLDALEDELRDKPYAEREVLLDTVHRALWESRRRKLDDAEWAIVRVHHWTSRVTRMQAVAVVDALVAVGGPITIIHRIAAGDPIPVATSTNEHLVVYGQPQPVSPYLTPHLTSAELAEVRRFGLDRPEEIEP